MKTKVYFNNSCSICRAEINNYKKHCNNDIDWVDISTCKDSEKQTGLNVDNLYRRMHVIEAVSYTHLTLPTILSV